MIYPTQSYPPPAGAEPLNYICYREPTCVLAYDEDTDSWGLVTLLSEEDGYWLQDSAGNVGIDPTKTTPSVTRKQLNVAGLVTVPTA